MLNKRNVFCLLVSLCFLPVMGLTGCDKAEDTSCASPEEAVETVVQAYQKQDNEILKICYGITPDALIKDKEINFEKKFFLSVNAKKVQVNETEVLFNENDYTYMGVYFEFITKDNRKIPYYEHFLVRQVKNGQYQVITQIDYPRTIIDKIKANSTNIQNSDLYTTYQKNEKQYASGNPEYADGIYQRFTELLKGMTTEMAVNLRFLGIIFFMVIAELLVLLIIRYHIQKPKKKKHRKIKDRAFRKF